MASCVRVVKTAFGDGLVAARDIAAGETVLTEQPAFLLLDDAPVTRPRLLAAVSGALGLAPGAEKSVLLYGGLELWLRCDAARRAVLLKIFSTPDDSEMAAFVLGVVETVRQQEEEKEQGEEDGAEVEPASARQQLAASEAQQHASKALCCWLLSSHATCCESKGETGCALYPTGKLLTVALLTMALITVALLTMPLRTMALLTYYRQLRQSRVRSQHDLPERGAARPGLSRTATYP